MQSRLVLTMLILAAAVGCRPFRGVKPQPPLTVAEARLALVEGLRLYAEQPRTVEQVADAAELLEQAARTLRDDFNAQWRAAEALAFLAENEAQPKARKTAAAHGAVLARRAKELAPERVEGYYWYAINVGLRADVDRVFGLKAVSEMETALKKAIELDERHDMAGPLRVLGILHLRTPGPPVSIGSARKGLRLLQRAVADFPQYPENYLYLAEALRENKRIDEAKEALAKVMDATVWPDRQFESKQWQAEARKLRATLSSTKSPAKNSR
jgi:tetratricopeptide (TPR) repeat protein